MRVSPLMQLPLHIQTVPPSARIAGLILERQTLAHNEADYAAVMASREHLREWSGDDWPEDDFSLEQNLKDLQGHIEDAENGFAYGYTVFGAERGRVLGSVYLYPSAFFVGRYQLAPEQVAALEAAQVLVDYWLLPEIEHSSAHGAIFEGLVDWLAREWGFAASIWATRPGMAARRALYERHGAECVTEAESRHTPGWRMCFHRR